MNISTCPSCGRRSLVHVVENVAFRIRGKRFTFREVPHLRCTRCGERLFDRASNRVVDAQRPRRRHAA